MQRALSGPLGIGLLIALAAVARVLFIGQESFWFDEIWAIKQVRGALPDVLSSLADEDVHPPLYPVALWGWIRVFGEAEWATRLLSAASGTGAVWVLYLIGRDLFDRQTGMAAAGILALNAYAVDFSQETRAYSLLLLLGLLATWQLVRWARAPRAPRAMALYVLCAIPLAYVHVFGSFVLLGHGLWAVIWAPLLRTRMCVAGAIVAAAFAPWVPVMLRQVGRVQEGFWIDPLDWTDPIKWLWYWSGYNIPLTIAFVLLVGRGLLRPEHRPFLLTWLLVPVVVPVALSLVGEPIFHHKYPIVIIGAWSLLAARGLLALPTPRWRALAAAVVAAMLVVGLPLTLYTKVNKEQYRELAALAERELDRGVVVIGDAGTRPYLSFYLTRAAEVRWLDGEADVAEAEAEARHSGGALLYVLVHPKTNDTREARLAKRWERGEEIVLKEARAIRYRVRPGVDAGTQRQTR